MPVMINVVPAPPAKVPLLNTLVPEKAPVEKLTLPRFPDVFLFQLSKVERWVPPTTIPAVVTEAEPNWFVISNVSAHATIGNANASNVKTTTRLM